MQDKIDAFLEAVDEQIACRLCHAEINEELRGTLKTRRRTTEDMGCRRKRCLAGPSGIWVSRTSSAWN